MNLLEEKIKKEAKVIKANDLKKGDIIWSYLNDTTFGKFKVETVRRQHGLVNLWLSNKDLIGGYKHTEYTQEREIYIADSEEYTEDENKLILKDANNSLTEIKDLLFKALKLANDTKISYRTLNNSVKYDQTELIADTLSKLLFEKLEGRN